MRLHFSRSGQLWLAFGAATAVGGGLYLVGALRNQSLDYWYLPYNLFLGIIPLLLAVWLKKILQTRRWKSWLPIAVTTLWLLFLPNSFYIITDFIHLPEYSRVDMVQDVVMLMQFSVLGLVAGFASVFLLHRVYLRSIGRGAWAIVAAALFLSSFAIYLGRELRWNSWDFVVNPIRVWGDVAMIFSDASHFSDALYMTVSFFVMLCSLYGLLWIWTKRHSW